MPSRDFTDSEGEEEQHKSPRKPISKASSSRHASATGGGSSSSNHQRHASAPEKPKSTGSNPLRITVSMTFPSFCPSTSTRLDHPPQKIHLVSFLRFNYLTPVTTNPQSAGRPTLLYLGHLLYRASTSLNRFLITSRSSPIR